MKERIEQRLKELRAEFESGQRTLAELDARQMELRDTLLRVSGAIQVLEEQLTPQAGQPEAVGGEERLKAAT